MKFRMLCLLFLFIGALASETTLQVNDLGTITVPHAFGYYQQLDNGTIMFYREAITPATISYYTFSYDPSSNTFSEETQAGQVDNIYGLAVGGSAENDFYLHFGYLYKAYYLEDDSTVVVFRVSQNELRCQAATGVTLRSWLFYSCEVVNPDTFALVLYNEVVAYNIITGASNHFLYFTTEPYVYYWNEIFRVDDNHFVFEFNTFAEACDTWYLFSASDLTLQRTMEYNHSFYYVNLLQGKEVSNNINGYFYLYASDPLLKGGGSLYECSWVADSIHTYLIPAAEGCSFFNVNQFGDDMTLVSAAFSEMGGIIFAYQAPIENNIEYTATYVVPELPFVTAQVSSEIVADIWRADGEISVRLLWRPHYLDHSPYYTFPEEDGDTRVNAAFMANDNLLVLTNAHIYRYSVQEVESADDHPAAPTHPQLQLYPNPLTAGTVLSIKPSLDRPGKVDIYNIKGQKVRSLDTTGSNAITWDRKDTAGQDVASGIYMVRYQAGDVTQNRKCVIVK